MSITREEAIKLLDKYVSSEKMKQHCYASESVMKALAEKLNQDIEKWALAGLLHDLDVEFTEANNHGLETEKILKEINLDNDIVDAIKMHNEAAHGIKRSTQFHHALAAGETITGLITATTLVYPDQKIHSIKPKSVTKRMKQKAFAASVSRENIMECEKLGIEISDFAVLCIDAMKEVSDQIGL